MLDRAQVAAFRAYDWLASIPMIGPPIAAIAFCAGFLAWATAWALLSPVLFLFAALGLAVEHARAAGSLAERLLIPATRERAVTELLAFAYRLVGGVVLIAAAFWPHALLPPESSPLTGELDWFPWGILWIASVLVALCFFGRILQLVERVIPTESTPPTSR